MFLNPQEVLYAVPSPKYNFGENECLRIIEKV